MDLEYDEFKTITMSGRHHIHRDVGRDDRVKFLGYSDLANQVDWRHSAVTSVKD